jgi:hypothetical protein
METVTSIRDKLADNFTEHIVTIDHNVLDKYDPEFALHIVCHPDVEDGQMQVPEEMTDFIDNISEDKEVRMHEMHMHIYANISEETLGIEEDLGINKQKKEAEKVSRE